MKVGILIPATSHRAGGLGDSARRLTEELKTTLGWTPEVLSLADKEAVGGTALWEPAAVHTFPVAGLASFGFAPGLSKCLKMLDVDLVHTHGLWTYLSVVTHTWSRRAGRPYVVTPQGMLDAWALRRSRWKKRAAGLVYEHRHLRDAACLHAVSTAEVEAFRAFGLSNPVCLIHNGVDLPPRPAALPLSPWAGQLPAGCKVLLYLGRLHPKKGLPNLLRAWAAARGRGRALAEAWRLVIVGWDQVGHEEELRQLAMTLELEKSVVFAGPLFGEARTAAYRHADALVLASFSEGMPLVVLEAWAHCLPVLMTPACNLPEGFAAEAALRAEPDPHSLALALETLFRATDAEREKMGRRGRLLVEQNFQWPQSAARMREVYDWLVNGSLRPACVSG